jgi:hypothetical protein
VLILDSAEEGLEYIELLELENRTEFMLLISKKFTVNGEPDTLGQGMCLIHDKIAGMGYQQDGMLEKKFFKIYKYALVDTYDQ